MSKANDILYDQAFQFYSELSNSEAAMEKMAVFGTSAEMLSERLTLLDTMAEAMKAQQIQIGQAQITTAQRQEAMRKLDTWMSRFIKAARLAFLDEPKHLKKIGIYVKE